MKKIFTICFTILFFNQFTKAQSHSQEAGLQSENDSYLAQGSDRYYTNGIFIYYRHALNFNQQGKLANKILGFEAGQKMYNPQSGSVFVNGMVDPRYIDRPFAGYLYLGSTLNLLYKNESSLKLGAQLGVVGPAAKGKQAQDFIHNTFGFYPPDGWQYQIENVAVINLSADYTKTLLSSSSVDLSFNAYANIGTGFDGAGFGPVLRAGKFNKLFNSAFTQASVMNKTNRHKTEHELFFYYKPLLNLVIHDATVQGKIGQKDVTSDEITATPNRLMVSNQLGVIYNTGNRWTFDFAMIFHTKDVKEMVRAHQWGSFTIMYHFD